MGELLHVSPGPATWRSRCREPFDDEAFELEQAAHRRRAAARAQPAVHRSTTAGALGELLGQQYVARYFPGSSKQAATQLVDALVQAMADEIAGARLDGRRRPGSSRSPSSRSSSAWSATPSAGRPTTSRSGATTSPATCCAPPRSRPTASSREAGKPVDRAEWQMNAFGSTPTTTRARNHTALPAGILQPPFFGQDRAVAANLGGHRHGDRPRAHATASMTRARSSTPTATSGTGGRTDDLARFAERRQVRRRRVLGRSRRCPGSSSRASSRSARTSPTSAGSKMAFRAYRALRKDAAKTYVADGFSEDQQFFLAVGQAWCGARAHRRDRAPADRRPALAAEVPGLRRAAQPEGVRRARFAVPRARRCDRQAPVPCGD